MGFFREKEKVQGREHRVAGNEEWPKYLKVPIF